MFSDLENSKAYYRKISLVEEARLKLPNMKQTIETLNEDQDGANQNPEVKLPEIGSPNSLV